MWDFSNGKLKPEEQRVLLLTGAAGALAIASYAVYKRWCPLAQGNSEQPVRVGLIGTGWAVKVQLPQFRRAGMQVTAIASRKEESAVTLAAQHHIVKPFGNVIELCQCPDVDLVSVVSPTYLHSEQMIAALVGGKHVLVDKPMARDGAEGERMLAAASAHSKQVAIVDHELRFTPAFQHAQHALQSGTIGAVVAIDVAVYLPGNAGPWSWWHDVPSGGGMLGAIGSHLIDAHRFLLDCEFTSVSAHLETLQKQREDPLTGHPRACTADDLTYMQYRVAARASSAQAPVWSQPDATILGRMAMGTIVGGAPSGVSHFVIMGSRGSVTLDSMTSSCTVADLSGKVLSSVKGNGSAFAKVGTHALGVALQRALGPRRDMAALRPAATIADGLAVVYVMDAARASAAQGGAWQTPKVLPAD
mmetsp:Transcript_11235/g.33726  ORF Transcript_11235/g.33726 Transcript_11235/m.33726 type:complete len:417 (+) Transcript_11235:86-1336(+)